MDVDTMKLEIEPEECCICNTASEELYSPEEHDAGAPPSQPPLRTMLLHLTNSKIVPSGRLCTTCIRKTLDSYNFSTMLSSKGPPPLGEKIRALRKRLHELTQKIDVFIVVGGGGANGAYREEDIIMVERDALAAASQADDAELTRSRNTRGDNGYQCTVCPAFFQRAAEYRGHAGAHGADSAAACWTCGAQFPGGAARDAALAAHRRAHARPAPAPAPAPAPLAARLARRLADRYVCGYDNCILRFVDRSNLLSHIRKCHAGSPPAGPEGPGPAGPAAPGPVPCDHCDRTFASAAAVKRHARVHRAAQEGAGWGGGGGGGGAGGGGETDEEGNKVEYLEVDTLDDEPR